MASLTPIERHIAGQPADRRRRWEKRMADRGFRRVTLYAREAQLPVVEGLKVALRVMDEVRLAAYQDLFARSLDDLADCLEADLARWDREGMHREALADIAECRVAAASLRNSATSLTANPAPSGAREEIAAKLIPSNDDAQ